MNKLGITGSGGSTKGRFGAAVLGHLEKRGVLKDVKFFSGTSVSALHAAFMTSGSAAELETIYDGFTKKSDIFATNLIPLRGVASLDPIMKVARKHINPENPRNVEAVACAVDYSRKLFPKVYGSNLEMEFEEWMGVVRGSATVPVLMESTNKYRDGGVKEYIPLSHALTKCEKVIAISHSKLQKEGGPAEKKPWYVPTIVWDLWLTVDKAMQQEIKIGDFMDLHNANKDRIILIQPDEEFKYGSLHWSKKMMDHMKLVGDRVGSSVDLSGLG